MKRKALGRGLSALIPASAANQMEPPRAGSSDYFVCPIERIHPQKGQPRRFFDEAKLDELVASLKEQGIVQPLVVRPTRDGSFVLIAGERRWRAAQRAGLHEVPVIVRESSDLEAFELALVENLQRQDLNPIEEAEAYKRLLDEHGYTQDELATRVGKDRSTVANGLRLLKLPDVAQKALIAGAISSGHARALLPLDRPATIQRALKLIIDKGLSVRQTEALVKQLLQPPPPAPKAPPVSPNQRDLESRLSRSLATRVQLSGNGPKGSIAIHYNSLDELDRLLERLL